jgi:hypothetical protein
VQHIGYEETLDNEARGAEDDGDFGKVREVRQHYVITHTGNQSRPGKLGIP